MMNPQAELIEPKPAPLLISRGRYSLPVLFSSGNLLAAAIVVSCQALPHVTVQDWIHFLLDLFLALGFLAMPCCCCFSCVCSLVLASSLLTSCTNADDDSAVAAALAPLLLFCAAL